MAPVLTKFISPWHSLQSRDRSRWCSERWPNPGREYPATAPTDSAAFSLIRCPYGPDTERGGPERPAREAAPLLGRPPVPRDAARRLLGLSPMCMSAFTTTRVRFSVELYPVIHHSDKPCSPREFQVPDEVSEFASRNARVVMRESGRAIGQELTSERMGAHVTRFVETRAGTTILGLALMLTGCTDKIVDKDLPDFTAPPTGAEGFLGYSDVDAKRTTCGNCHSGKQAQWEGTSHSHAWTTLANSGALAKLCEGCHTVSSLGNVSTGSNAGYAGTQSPRALPAGRRLLSRRASWSAGFDGSDAARPDPERVRVRAAPLHACPRPHSDRRAP